MVQSAAVSIFPSIVVMYWSDWSLGRENGCWDWDGFYLDSLQPPKNSNTITIKTPKQPQLTTSINIIKLKCYRYSCPAPLNQQ